MRLQTTRLAMLLGLAAVAAASHALDLTVSVNTSVDLKNALVAYHSTDPNLDDEGGAPIGDIPAGLYTTTASVNGDLSQYESYRYTLLATYQNDTPGDEHEGVVVGLNPETTVTALTTDFSGLFGVSESSILEAIKGIYDPNPIVQILSQATLADFASNNLDKFPMGLTGGSLVGFSNGTVVGSVVAAPVPEPASLAALGLGAAALLRRRRKSA